jgi:hypothetical protein
VVLSGTDLSVRTTDLHAAAAVLDWAIGAFIVSGDVFAILLASLAEKADGRVLVE